MAASLSESENDEGTPSPRDIVTPLVEPSSPVQNFPSPEPGSIMDNSNHTSNHSCELDLSNYPKLSNAISLFVLRSNISKRNTKFLLDLLNIVKDLSSSGKECEIPNMHSLANPSNMTLLESYEICPADYSRVSDKICSSCGATVENTNFISIGNLKSQFTSLVTDQNFLKIVRETKQKICNGLAGDIFQGETYKNVSQGMGMNDMTLTLNSDGFLVNSTSKIEPWPIYLIINELGFKHRFSIRYVVLLGIFYGTVHPNLNKLLEVCLEKQMDVLLRGLTVNGQTYTFKMMFSSLDKPARASLMEMTSHSSTQGCMFCFTQMETIHSKGRQYRTFPFENAAELLREDDDFTATGISSSINSQIQFGQKDVTFFENFRDFKPVSSQIIDLLHCLFGGCVKKLVYLLFDYEYRENSFSLFKNLNTINASIQKLKPPTIFCTRIRSIKFVKFFRAHEFRAFILYYGPMILRDHLSEAQFNNLILLSQISFLASQSFFDEISIASLEIKIHAFLTGFAEIYGKQFISINFHELVHIPDNIRNNGAIYQLSCFGFENLNKLLKETVHGSRRPDLEIFSKINMLFNSVRNINLESCDEITTFVRDINSSTKRVVPKITVSGFKVVSKPKASSDTVPFVYDELFEVPKVFKDNFAITSSTYDRRYRFKNSLLINTVNSKSFKILKIYYAVKDGERKIIFQGLEGKTKRVYGIFHRLCGDNQFVTKEDIQGYQLAFLVKDKICSLLPNFKELYM